VPLPLDDSHALVCPNCRYVINNNELPQYLTPVTMDSRFISDWVTINDAKAKNGVVSPHPAGANFMMADGSVKFLLRTIDPELLKALRCRRPS